MNINMEVLTAGPDLPRGHALAEEERGGAGGAERREEREDGRVREGEVLQGEVDAEETEESVEGEGDGVSVR